MIHLDFVALFWSKITAKGHKLEFCIIYAEQTTAK